MVPLKITRVYTPRSPSYIKSSRTPPLFIKVSMASKQAIHIYTLFLNLLTPILLICPFASCVLVPQTPLNLQYHQGVLLAGDGPIKLHLTFYGGFTPLEKHTITTFLNSLSGESALSHLVKISSALHKSVRLSVNSLSTEGSIRVGRKELRSSKQSGLSSEHSKANGFSSFKLKTHGSASAELQESGSSSSKLSSQHPKASGLSSFKLEGIGSSSSELQASGSPSFELKASGSSSSQQKASGSFSPKQKAIGVSEVKARGSTSPQQKASGSSSSEQEASGPSSTVANWWSLTQAYTDLRGNPVAQTVLIERENFDNYSLGKLLSHSDIALLAKRSSRAVAHYPLSIHVILTAADVGVEGFCMHACGQHAHVQSDGELGRVVYAWVGNAKEQCPGYCSWPFVRAEYGPPDTLGAPNSASADGMIINLAKVLVEAATNPYGDGYHLRGIGVGSVCTGVYGEGAFPGYPGHVFKDALTGASFNVMGIHQSKFLLPYIWNPLTLSCAVQP